MKNGFFALALLLLFCYGHAMELSESLRINGYADLYFSSKTDTEDAGKANSDISASGGIQGRYQLNDRFAFTAQFYAEEEENYDIETKWLYADAYLGADITLRAGRFQLPVFKSVETGFIGYSMPWAENPLEFYGAGGYDDFTGGELLYRTAYDSWDFLFQLSYGVSDNSLPAEQNGNHTDTETDNLLAFTTKVSAENYWISLGLAQADSELTRIEQQGSTHIDLGTAEFSMLTIEGQYDYHNWMLQAGYLAGWMSARLPDERSYYVSLAYAYETFTPYVYYSTKLFYEIPAPTLSASLNSDGDLPLVKKKEENDVYAVGVRYDLQPGVALKLHYSHLTTLTEYGTSNTTSEDQIKAVINVIF